MRAASRLAAFAVAAGVVFAAAYGAAAALPTAEATAASGPRPSQGQEAFIEGHLEAFRVLGVPTVHIRYDNLKSAVTRVLFGRTRTESDRWTLFRSHAGFDAFYCMPGIEGAREGRRRGRGRPVPPQPPRPAARRRNPR